ncbi:MAG: histidine kinase, partial [Candidatus Altarchaeum sp. CG_4_10_14_0_8_um_filter_32_851]
MNKCRDVIKPEIIPFYEKVFVDGKTVVVLEVNGIDKPYYLFKNNKKTYYIRVGTTVREATREELRRLFQASGSIHYDENLVYNSSLEDIATDKVTEYFENFRGMAFENLPEEEKENILINSKILTNGEDKILCTVAGILLFGKEPAKFLSQSGIMFAHFKGREISGELIDRKELNKTIAENIRNICEIIKLNLKHSSKIEGLERVEKEEIPERVIREAIANACIHRDYTIYGAKIRVFMFEDRLEIRSPGIPPNTVTVDNMKTGISVYRNPVIVKFINDYHLAEGMGRGIPMIIREMKKISGKEPKIEI